MELYAPEDPLGKRVVGWNSFDYSGNLKSSKSTWLTSRASTSGAGRRLRRHRLQLGLQPQADALRRPGRGSPTWRGPGTRRLTTAAAPTPCWARSCRPTIQGSQAGSARESAITTAISRQRGRRGRSDGELLAGWVPKALTALLLCMATLLLTSGVAEAAWQGEARRRERQGEGEEGQPEGLFAIRNVGGAKSAKTTAKLKVKTPGKDPSRGATRFARWRPEARRRQR